MKDLLKNFFDVKKGGIEIGTALALLAVLLFPIIMFATSQI